MNIIPKPKNITEGRPLQKGISFEKKIYTNVNGFMLEYAAVLFNQDVLPKETVPFSFLQISDEFGLEMKHLPEVLQDKEEGYLLKVDAKGVVIAAGSSKGLFYGIQTCLQLKEQGCERELEIIDWPDNDIRGYHFESRFGIPKFERMIEIIDELCKYKFNTILMELEDKFPYEEAKGITSVNALDKDQLKEIIRYANDRYIDIIPLQQTLGHVEYILKNDDYYPMREVRSGAVNSELPFSFNPIGNLSFNDIDEFCPSNGEVYGLIEKMCREMAEKYPKSKYMHIGCDEAWNLINCELCKAKYGEKGFHKVFLEHTNRVAGVITSLNKIPVIWDDMLRGFSEEEFELLDKNIVIMCWLYYNGDLEKGISLIKKYREAGFHVIGASSAKCCEGMSSDYLDMPNMKDRLINIDDWSKLSTEFDLMGVITTVWSNYTGTIAPPHPFFDTMWYPLIFSADKYWNTASDSKEFEERFLENFFGVEGIENCFGNENELVYEKTSFIARNCKRNKYIAEVYKFASLLSIYRQKSMATYREMYKLYDGSSKREKAIVVRKVKELETMREYLKPEISRLISINFNKTDAKEFVNSRFLMDEMVNQR
ncbi:family 20 glycosylhydrolase [Anaerocolumna xylanovorans]|uniref:Glycosyl hydrolase family 20, domain 2 n=1 Tax=Anaerocolumna xylanovorans DSM 12503 TaxID=1121345 RepID=A0A1M7YIR5_9FIRM|nr:family 20 glycosylhydrolase [Anaerocolumna xylanovorans]SHO52398.1 Glycosyl hydrolase family 20, domain 2 [Anaerocolumna xylanovorans DSM 12503]